MVLGLFACSRAVIAGCLPALAHYGAICCYLLHEVPGRSRDGMSCPILACASETKRTLTRSRRSTGHRWVIFCTPLVHALRIEALAQYRDAGPVDLSEYGAQLRLWQADEHLHKLVDCEFVALPIDDFFFLNNVTLERGDFAPGRFQRVSRTYRDKDEAWNRVLQATILDETRTVEDLLAQPSSSSSAYCATSSLSLVQLPHGAADLCERARLALLPRSFVAAIPACITDVPVVFRVPAVELGEHDDEDSDGDVSDPELRPSTRARYPVPMRLAALQLSHLIKDQDKLDIVCKHAAQLILDPNQSTQVIEHIEQREMPLQKRTTLHRDHITLDVMHMLYRQEEFTRSPPHIRRRRYLSPDCSPQAGYEYMLVRETVTFRDMRNPPTNEFMGTKLEYRKAPMPATVLGKKAGTLANKWQRLHHVGSLVSGPHVDEWRAECAGFVSDQSSTERRLPSVPALHTEDGVQRVLQAASAIKRRESRFCDVQHLYYFNSMLQVDAHIHIVWNGFERGAKSWEGWVTHEKGLRAITHVLGVRFRCEWFVKHRMQNATSWERKVILSYDECHINWRWENIEDAEGELVQAWVIFIKYYDPADAGCKSLADGDHQTNLDIAAANPEFILEICVVACVGKATGRAARWLLGCKCHGDALKAQATYAARKRVMKELGVADGVCFHKGHRGPELALGHYRVLAQNIRECFSPDLIVMLAAVSREAAARAMAMLNHFALRTADEIELKLHEMWGSLPHKIVGCFAQVHGEPVHLAKRCAREVIEEASSIDDLSHAEGVTLKFFDEGSALFHQLNAFASVDSTNICDFKELYIELEDLANIDVTEISIEGDHRTTKRTAEACGGPIKPATMCARLRFPVVEELLQSPAFVNFVIGNWDKKGNWARVLAHELEPYEVSRLTFAERCAKVYRSGVNEQFDFSEHVPKAVSAWADLERNNKKSWPPVPAPASMIVDYYKNRFVSGVLFSAPRALVDLAEADAELSGAIVPHDVGSLPTFIDILITIMGDRDSAEPVVADDDVCFTVLNAKPEALHRYTPRHISPNNTSIRIAIFETAVFDVETGGVVVDARQSRYAVVDLRSWAARESFEKATRHIATRQLGLGSINLTAPLQRLSTLPLEVTPTLYDDSDMLDALLRDNQPQSIPLSDQRSFAVAQLSERGAFDTVDKWVTHDTLKDVNIPVLHTLEQDGVVRMRRNDFGEVDLCLRASSLKVSFLTDYDNFVQERAMPARDVRSVQLCRLELIHKLTALMWMPQYNPPPLTIDGVRAFDINAAFRGSKLYLVALDTIDQILGKDGCLEEVRHGLPHHYYACLLHLEDLSPIADITDLAALKDRDFAKLLRGLLPLALGDHALADGDGAAGAILDADNAIADAEDHGDDVPDVVPGVVSLHGVKINEPITIPVDGYPGVQVNFDDWVKASGTLRAYVTCQHHPRARCCKYVQVTPLGLVFVTTWQPWRAAITPPPPPPHHNGTPSTW